MLKVVLFKFNQNSSIHQKILMKESHIVLDVETSPLSSESMQHKLDRAKTNEAKNITIFRTPHNNSQSKKNLFEPSVISIGPFHHGKKSLKAMEEHKWRFLESFLSRGDTSLDLCISEMRFLEEKTRRCYSETFDDLDSHAFVEMMLLDGCFVLKYFSKLREENVSYSRVIDHDLLLLENQIPFFIVEKLYDISILNQEDRMDFVKSIAFNFLVLSTEDFIGDPDEIPDPPAEIHHLVHLYYHYLVPNPEKPVVLISKSFFSLPNSIEYISTMVIPSVTELKKQGLKFRPKSNPKHMLDISFEHGVLQIPRLAITDSTKPIFANLIAFEQSNYGKPHSPFTTFVTFLDYLVNTPKDVTKLQECRIIENRLGSEEELTNFINQVTDGIINGSNHYLADLYMEVNKYIGSSWNRQRAKFVRDYFRGRRKTFSLTALTALVLTAIQTYYAVYAYKFPPSS